jgi:hypothetical protein
VLGTSLTLVAACSETHVTADNAAIERTMSRYVTAMSRGDFDSAMKERCEASRIKPEKRDVSLDQTSDLFDMAGITGVAVVPAGPITIKLDGSTSGTQFGYRVVTHNGRSDKMHGVAVVEDGAVRLCGSAAPDIGDVSSALEAPVISGTQSDRPPQELLPNRIAGHYRQIEDNELSAASSGRVDGWTRVWLRDTFGGVRLSASRYSTAQQASDALSQAVHDLAFVITEMFAVPDVPRAVGVRYSAAAWTWLQPPGAGYQIDAIYVLHGDTVILTEAAALLPSDSHDEAIMFAKATEALAG